MCLINKIHGTIIISTMRICLFNPKFMGPSGIWRMLARTQNFRFKIGFQIKFEISIEIRFEIGFKIIFRVGQSKIQY